MFRSKTLLLGFALAILLVLTWKGAPRWWTAVLALTAAGAAWGFGGALSSAWPPGLQEVGLVRGVTAMVACLAVLREALAPPKFPADRRVVLGVLGGCAVLAVAAFYNLGHPQFYDSGTREPSYLHTYDLRAYYPLAKYWHEVRYDGVYVASLEAYAQDKPDSLKGDAG